VFLDQTLGLFRRLPASWTSWLNQRSILKRVAKYAARTRPQDVGELTVSMLMGEDGRQQKDLDQLVNWLEEQLQPDVICLSNALLIGMARQLKERLNSALVCTLQGEDTFLDALPEGNRAQAWQILSDRSQDIDAFVSPSAYFGNLMQSRIGFPASKLHVVPNGIPIDGYQQSPLPKDPPVLGYFARMSREKGLPLLVDAYLQLKTQPECSSLKLMVGGGMGPTDIPVVEAQKRKLKQAGVEQDVSWHPNLDREEKMRFFSKLTVFSVPALYGETFGLYLLESMAAGVPVVQPPHAAFPELIASTGAGRIAKGLEAGDLADAIQELLLNHADLKALSEAARTSVGNNFQSKHMAQRVLEVYDGLIN